MRFAQAKIVIWLLLIFWAALARADGQHGIPWAVSLEDALLAAEDSGRYLLVDVYKPSCKWCVALAETTFVDSAFMVFSRGFVWAQVDAEEDSMLAAEFRVFGYPTVILLDPSSQEVDRIVGYLRPQPFISQIEDYLAGRGTFAAIREAVAEDSMDVVLLFRLGLKYHQRGYWDRSLSLFEEVVRLDPGNEQSRSDSALSYQGEALRREQRTDEAVARFQQLIDRYPQSELGEETELEIGYAYQKAERKTEALAVYESFLDDHPGHQYEQWIKRQVEKLSAQPAQEP